MKPETCTGALRRDYSAHFDETKARRPSDKCEESAGKLTKGSNQRNATTGNDVILRMWSRSIHPDAEAQHLIVIQKSETMTFSSAWSSRGWFPTLNCDSWTNIRLSTILPTISEQHARPKRKSTDTFHLAAHRKHFSSLAEIVGADDSSRRRATG